jgi:hypothetical protein
MKTVRDWLNTIADKEIREAAIENTDKDIIDTEEPSLASSIVSSFRWLKSPQGFEYWDNIHKRALHNTLKTIEG